MSGLVAYILWHNSRQDPAKRTWQGFSRESLQDWVMYIKVWRGGLG
jgi:hypothetical protein